LRPLNIVIGFIILVLLDGCTPVQMPITNQYQLAAYSQTSSTKTLHRSILISQPEAIAGYQTEQMLYIKKRYQLTAFAQNAWISPPAYMLYPLLIQSFQQSGAFSAVASSPYADVVDYRLDTQILAIEQNFLVKPSVFNLSLKVVVTQIKNNRVLASRIFNEHIRCKADTPYGGVLAANQATLKMTQRIKDFAIKYIENDIASENAISEK